MEKAELDRISGIIVDCAIQIHRATGPGLKERVYEGLLAPALRARRLTVKRQKRFSPNIAGFQFDGAFRPDLIVENAVVVEIKADRRPSYIHERQLLTYLKVTDFRLGLVLNFGAPLMKDGIRRLVNKI